MVETRVVQRGEQTYVECVAGVGRIESERDALDMVAACGENGTYRLLLPAGCLAEDFYHLGTGLAGAILLKFAVYHLKVAAEVDPAVVRGKFAEMVVETNRGREFRVLYDRESAEEGLLSE